MRSRGLCPGWIRSQPRKRKERESMAEEKRFLSAADVSQIMECSTSRAYNLIRQLNAEMTEKGFIVMAGKINAKYFYERIYDGKASV